MFKLEIFQIIGEYTTSQASQVPRRYKHLTKLRVGEFGSLCTLWSYELAYNLKMFRIDHRHCPSHAKICQCTKFLYFSQFPSEVINIWPFWGEFTVPGALFDIIGGSIFWKYWKLKIENWKVKHKHKHKQWAIYIEIQRQIYILLVVRSHEKDNFIFFATAKAEVTTRTGLQHTHTHTHTQTHTHTHTHTHTNTHTHTQTLSNTQTHKHSQTPLNSTLNLATWH